MFEVSGLIASPVISFSDVAIIEYATTESTFKTGLRIRIVIFGNYAGNVTTVVGDAQTDSLTFLAAAAFEGTENVLPIIEKFKDRFFSNS